MTFVQVLHAKIHESHFCKYLELGNKFYYTEKIFNFNFFLFNLNQTLSFRMWKKLTIKAQFKNKIIPSVLISLSTNI